MSAGAEAQRGVRTSTTMRRARKAKLLFRFRRVLSPTLTLTLILILLLAMLIPLGLFDGPDKPGPSSDIIRGCTDSTAQNHDANATEDDGSCTYAVVVIEGCMNSAATNYEPTASSDDGSCVYPPPSVLGCTASLVACR